MDEDVAAIVARELGGPPDAVERVAEGLLQETYLVEQDGAGFVLQFAGGEEGDEDALRRGLHCYRLLADEPVPVPDAVTGAVRSFDGRRYTLVERLPGSSIKDDPSPERARVAGSRLAAIHDAASFGTAGWLRFDDAASDVPTPGVLPFPEGSQRARIGAEVDDAIERFRARCLDDADAAAERFHDRFLDDLPRAFEPVLCHGDYSPDNLLFDGDELTGVVDFDRAVAGHAWRDLAHAATAFWMHDPTAEWDVRGCVYDGYREARSLDGFERVEPVYRVTTLVRVVGGMLALDELSDYERQFYDRHVARTVEEATADLVG
jgi:Ser/Thr protein kinase RdoA (MazF antagonist)